MRKIIIFFRNLNRIWLMLALALILGLLAAVLFSKFLKDREQALEIAVKKRASGGATVEVIAASMNIPKGAVLGAQNLSKREILADLVNEEMIKVSDFGRVDGVKSARPIQAGLPLRFTDITERPKGFSEALEPGLRAITIDVDEINSMSQMVKPGNLVDLMLIVPDQEDKAGGSRVVMVLQKVKVLATGQSVAPANQGAKGEATVSSILGVGGKEQRYSNFTFEVTPQDAARIALAQQMGKIRAMLRGNDDLTHVTLANITTQAMLNAPDKLGKLQAFSGKPAVVEYIIGGKGSAPAMTIDVPSLFPGAGRPQNGANPAQSGASLGAQEALRQQIIGAMNSNGAVNTQQGQQ